MSPASLEPLRVCPRRAAVGQPQAAAIPADPRLQQRATVSDKPHPKVGGRLVPSGLNTQLAPSTHAHGVFFLSF